MLDAFSWAGRRKGLEKNRKKMSNKILYICQEISPYVPDSEQSLHCRALLQAMQEHGTETRTFMPRYGSINERRHQLHEVIRLSGMNLIINDNDHQLIIKVASIPSIRIQIYFIDNDDFFARKPLLGDQEQMPFEDNNERAIFFARGVLETVKKLRWEPAIVHCHGWISSIAPIYLRKVFADDPIFRNLKIVVSLYDDAFAHPADPELKQKIASEGVDDEKLSMLDNPTYENLCRFVISYADGVVIASDKVSRAVRDIVAQSGKPSMEVDPKEAGIFDQYNQFYEAIQH